MHGGSESRVRSCPALQPHTVFKPSDLCSRAERSTNKLPFQKRVEGNLQHIKVLAPADPPKAWEVPIALLFTAKVRQCPRDKPWCPVPRRALHRGCTGGRRGHRVHLLPLGGCTPLHGAGHLTPAAHSCPLFNEHLTAGTFCTDPRTVYCQNSPAGEVERGGGVPCRPLSQPRIAAHGKQRTLFPRRGVPQGQRGAMPGTPRAAARPPPRRCPVEGAATAEVFPAAARADPGPAGLRARPRPRLPPAGKRLSSSNSSSTVCAGSRARIAPSIPARLPLAAPGAEMPEPRGRERSRAGPAPPRRPPRRRGDGRRWARSSPAPGKGSAPGASRGFTMKPLNRMV